MKDPLDEKRSRTVLLAALVVGMGGAAVLAVVLRRRQSPSSRPLGGTPSQRPAGTDRLLRYPVPVGQDPARVLAVLHVAGLAATLDEGGTAHEVVISAHDGVLDRERVRSVIADAGLDMSGGGTLDAPVRFADEAAPRP